MLHLLSTETPQWIFPGRRIGELRPAYEASFLALEENPVEDLGALRKIALRLKQGQVLEADAQVALPGIGQVLAHRALREGVDSAIEEYHRLRREQPEGYDFSEPQLNALGYALIQHNKVEDAVGIFRLNVEMFPESFNSYDSLGEAYLLMGRRDAAIEQYRRALELNPHNQNAVEKLWELGENGE